MADSLHNPSNPSILADLPTDDDALDFEQDVQILINIIQS